MDIISPIYGGIGILEKVENDNASISAWEARASATWGRHVNIFDAGFNASVGQPYIWVVSDGNSSTISPSAWLGRDLTSRSNVRVAIEQLSTDVDVGLRSSIAFGIPVPSFDAEVVVTNLFYFPAPKMYGLEMVTTVWSGNDSRLVIVSLVIDAYLNPVLALSPGAVATVTDHTGFSFSQGDCAPEDALSELDGTAGITTMAMWTIRMGTCCTLFPQCLLLAHVSHRVYKKCACACTILLISQRSKFVMQASARRTVHAS